jgi:hypothetical protein
MGTQQYEGVGLTVEDWAFIARTGPELRRKLKEADRIAEREMIEMKEKFHMDGQRQA